jgi:hypothetical protein
LSFGVAPYNVVEIFDVSEEATASFFIEGFFCLKAVGSGFLHIVIKYLSVYTASHPVGQQSVYCLIRGTNKLTTQSKSDIVAMLLTLILLLCSSRLRSTFLTTTKTMQFRRPLTGKGHWSFRVGFVVDKLTLECFLHEWTNPVHIRPKLRKVLQLLKHFIVLYYKITVYTHCNFHIISDYVIMRYNIITYKVILQCVYNYIKTHTGMKPYESS